MPSPNAEKKCREHVNGRICNGSFKPGLAFAPVYWRLDGQPARVGDTINPVGSVLVRVWKCAKCGHSIKPLKA